MRAVSTTSVTVAGTGATGSALAPGTAREVVLSSVTVDALVTFDGTFPGNLTGAHKIYAAQNPIRFPVGVGSRIGVISALGGTGTTVNVTWLEEHTH